MVFKTGLHFLTLVLKHRPHPQEPVHIDSIGIFTQDLVQASCDEFSQHST